MQLPLRTLIPIALASLLIIFLMLSRAPLSTRLAPASAIQPFSTTETVPAGGLVGAATLRSQLNISFADGVIEASEQPRFSADLDRALDYVSERFGHSASGSINVIVNNNPACGLSGVAYTEVRNVHVFTCSDIPRQRAVNILAHEFVHQLAQDYYGNAHLSADVILMEGVATWGAGSYWLGDQPDLRSFVRTIYGSNLLPLASESAGRASGEMNQLYYQWASFIDYLIAQYGRDAFDRLYISGSRSAGSADYQGVYGKGLGELEGEWRAWLTSNE